MFEREDRKNLTSVNFIIHVLVREGTFISNRSTSHGAVFWSLMSLCHYLELQKWLRSQNCKNQNPSSNRMIGKSVNQIASTNSSQESVHFNQSESAIKFIFILCIHPILNITEHTITTSQKLILNITKSKHRFPFKQSSECIDSSSYLFFFCTKPTTNCMTHSLANSALTINKHFTAFTAFCTNEQKGITLQQWDKFMLKKIVVQANSVKKNKI